MTDALIPAPSTATTATAATAEDVLLDAGFKSYPPAAPPCRISQIGQRHWNLLAGDLPLPLAVLRRSALEHNLAWMQDYARRKGVALAPHGKTTLSPELFARQLAAGAWGLSFATVFQLVTGVAAGVRRAIIANQVLADADLDGLALLLARHADLRVWFLVDSQAQLVLIEDWAARRPQAPRRLEVLLEISALNDQHAYLRFDPAAGGGQAAPQVGDRVALGISHPCTTFDKWRWMPVVEDDWRVSGAISTRF